MIKNIVSYSIILIGIYAYKNIDKIRIIQSNDKTFKIQRKAKADRYRNSKDLIHIITWLAVWIIIYDLLGGVFHIMTGHSFYRVFVEIDETDEEKYSTLWMFKLSFWALILNFLSYRILLKRSPKKLLIIILRPFFWVLGSIKKL